MRLSEAAQLRIKDVDFQRREITICDGKGGKDRLTMLPLSLVQPLREQVEAARAVYEEDRVQQWPGVALPGAPERKYSQAGKQLGWFWFFPVDMAKTPEKPPCRFPKGARWSFWGYLWGYNIFWKI